MMNSLILLIARILLMALFVYTGMGIFQAPGGTINYFASLSLPMPQILVWLVATLKLVGGVALLIGLCTRPAAYALAAFCVGAAIIGHSNIAETKEALQLLKDFAIAGGLLALAAAGPGAISFDALRNRR